MREIKFRVFDKEEKQFIYAEPVYGFFPSLSMEDEEELSKKHKISRYGDIQQFTGLLDKQGKEIYEGDIVKYNQMSKGIKPKQWSIPVEIIWNSKKASFDFKDSYNGLIYVDYEVVGNIYEDAKKLK